MTSISIGVPAQPTAYEQALTLHRSGDLAAAHAAYVLIVQQQSDHADAWHGLGVIALQVGDPASAADCIGRAIDLESGNFGFYINHGSALQALQQPQAALQSYDRAIALRSDIADAHYNRGVVLHTLGRLKEAVASFDRALALTAEHPEAWFNRGVVLQALQQPQQAVHCYDQAIALRADFAQAYCNRGAAFLEMQQWPAALTSLEQAIACRTDYADAYGMRGEVLRQLQQPDAALASLDQAIALQPELALAHAYRGDVLRNLHQYAEAVASYDRAIGLQANMAPAWQNRGIALDALGDQVGAEQSFVRALAIDPQLSESHHSLAFLKQVAGDTSAAIDSYRRALACAPGRDDSHTGLLYCLSSEDKVDPRALFAEYQRFGEQFEGILRATWPVHANLKDPERHLHVGFVSGDFFNHAAATFIEPMLQALSQSGRFTLHGYYNHTVHDAVTQRIRRCCAHWHEVAGLSHTALAQTIRDDGIDILIDLSGHTARHRLCTFAHKPAPLQVTWIGFPGTSGLQAMDYHFTDRYFLPPGDFDAQFTEKLVYLPSAVCFQPSADAPPVNTLPALGRGHLTFGSFNRRNKMNPSVIALWARVLQALPTADMVLGGMEGDQQADLAQCFAREGIAPQRLRFFPKSDMASYLGLHHQVDLCLDTFPYTGLTTTMHALWMGVPTLSLSGSTPISRQSSLVTGQLGLPDLVARDASHFVKLAQYWAAHPEALATIRASLRTRLSATPLGQPALLVQGLEHALRQMWVRWCQQLPAVSFTA